MPADISTTGQGGPVRRRCPICGKPPSAAHRPFCSRRCADLDLGHWLRGDYRVPTEERPADGVPGAADSGDGEEDPFGRP